MFAAPAAIVVRAADTGSVSDATLANHPNLWRSMALQSRNFLQMDGFMAPGGIEPPHAASKAAALSAELRGLSTQGYPAPTRATLCPLGGGSSVGRAPGCGPGGRGFESRPPPRDNGAAPRPRCALAQAGVCRRRRPPRRPSRRRRCGHDVTRLRRTTPDSTSNHGLHRRLPGAARPMRSSCGGSPGTAAPGWWSRSRAGESPAARTCGRAYGRGRRAIPSVP